ncbi:MAG: sodium:proton exchanger [Nautilia sp.]|nr:MAG: sodium:proton exchanger [Nautilia sp.]
MDTTLLIIAIFFISLLFNIPLSKFKIPPIIGYIITGIIITSTFHIEKETIEHIAEFGIIFLMFLIGVEFSPEKLKNMKKEVFVYGTLEMLIVGVGFGILTHLFFKIEWSISLIIGGALALSSTAIVLKLLNESHEISKPYGRNSLGILLFQDIAVIPILIAISIITNKNLSLSDLISQTIIGFLGLLGAIYLIGKYIAPFILKQAAKTKSNELFLATLFLIVLSAAQIAHFFELSYSLGAFLGGMIISETPYKYQIEADLAPFRDLLLALFFVSVGLSVDLNFAISNIISILGLFISIMIIKAIFIFAILHFFEKKRVSIKTALTLSQVSEFAFVIFALLSQYKLVDESLLQKLIVAVVLSMIVTPFILKYLYQILPIFDKNKNEEIPLMQPTKVEGHTIIIGYNNIGKKVAKKLNQLCENYVIIDNQIENVREGIKEGIAIIFGNAANKHILESLNIKEAKNVIITTQNENDIHLISENILSLNPNIKIIVISDETSSEKKYYEENKIIRIYKNKEIAKKIIELFLKLKLKEKNGSN